MSKVKFKRQLNMVEDEYENTLYSSTKDRLGKLYNSKMHVEEDPGINNFLKKNGFNINKDHNDSGSSFEVSKTCTDDGKIKGAYVLYLDWIFDKVGRKETRKYSDLLLLLFKYIFVETDICPMDVNRARDGIALRKIFYENNKKISPEQFEEMMHDDCTWLEMILGLACKIDDQMMFDMSMGNRTSQWFWLIIEQMELDQFDNKNMDEKRVIQMLNDFGARNYKNNGKDGIFKCSKDVRNVEIWYQMMQYFNENWVKF